MAIIKPGAMLVLCIADDYVSLVELAAVHVVAPTEYGGAK